MNPSLSPSLSPSPNPTLSAAVIVTAICLCGLYVTAAVRLRGRGDAWPYRRDVLFCLGGVVLCAGSAQPVLPNGGPTWGPFTEHVFRHVAGGMAAPLLLASARPLTLTWRALPVAPRRVLHRVLRTRVARAVTWLPTAAVLDIGGLWLLYRTPLFAAAHHRPWLDALVHVHVVLAGLLFTMSALSLDPVRRAGRLGFRVAVLVVAAAAHAVLAKSLYVDGPAGTAFAPEDLRAGAMLMYYGGDAVEVVIGLVIGGRWLRARGRDRSLVRGDPPPALGASEARAQ
ncbi:cytochrome c oxidase assembly protein [Streptomyces sp. NPDC048436]|uniref:cytochrome c oxidase assembly protein n=1 Tax=Streptomyces sp. NPDC048436 TaxID=3365550 RepID=UPI00371FAAB1